MGFLNAISGKKRYIINGLALFAEVLNHFVAPGMFPPEWQAYALPVVAVLNVATKVVDTRAGQ
jgi:hypothetical protein